MKIGEKKILEYYKGLYFKTQAPVWLIEVSAKGVILIKSNPSVATRVYVNVLNSFNAVIRTIPIDIIPQNTNPNTYISAYVG